MAAEKYKVVLTGELAVGADRESVVAALAALFKQSPEAIGRMLNGRPVPINQEFERAQADRVMERITAAGARCRVEPVAVPMAMALELEPADDPEPDPEPAPAQPAPVGAAVQPPPPRDSQNFCPKCGAPRTGAESCEKCGVIFAKLAAAAPDAAAPLAGTAPPPRGNVRAANTAADLGEFVGPNYDRYAHKFENFRAGGGGYAFTWHWPCLFVPFYWAVYRKMWGWAVVMFFSGLIPLTNILWAATANYLYFRHAKKRTEAIRKTGGSDDAVFERIRASGGVSGLAVLAAIGLSVAVGMYYGHLVGKRVGETMQETAAKSHFELGGQPLAEGAKPPASMRTPAAQQTMVAMTTYAMAISLWKSTHKNVRDVDRLRKELGMDRNPPEDGWKNVIDLVQDGTELRLESSGADGKAGTDDDIAFVMPW